MISQTNVIMAFTILLRSLPISPVCTAKVRMIYPCPYTETVYLYKVSNIWSREPCFPYHCIEHYHSTR